MKLFNRFLVRVYVGARSCTFHHRPGRVVLQKGQGARARCRCRCSRHGRVDGAGRPQSKEAVELLLEWFPDLRPRLSPLSRDEVWRLLRRRLGSAAAGSPWTMPLRASIPPLTEKLRQTMKARMAAFSWARTSDS